MLKTVNKPQIRCPVGFYDGIIAVIWMKKFQIDSENEKTISIFKVFIYFLSNF